MLALVPYRSKPMWPSGVRIACKIQDDCTRCSSGTGWPWDDPMGGRYCGKMAPHVFFLWNTKHNTQLTPNQPYYSTSNTMPPYFWTHHKTHQTNPPRSYLSNVEPFHIISYSVAIRLCFLDPRGVVQHTRMSERSEGCGNPMTPPTPVHQIIRRRSAY